MPPTRRRSQQALSRAYNHVTAGRSKLFGGVEYRTAHKTSATTCAVFLSSVFIDDVTLTAWSRRPLIDRTGPDRTGPLLIAQTSWFVSALSDPPSLPPPNLAPPFSPPSLPPFCLGVRDATVQGFVWFGSQLVYLDARVGRGSFKKIFFFFTSSSSEKKGGSTRLVCARQCPSQFVSSGCCLLGWRCARTVGSARFQGCGLIPWLNKVVVF